MRTHMSSRSGIATVVLSVIVAAAALPVTARASGAGATADEPHAMQPAADSHGNDMANDAAMQNDAGQNDAAMNHAPMQLAEVAICRKVEDREPVAAGSSFGNGVENLYCFTDIRNAGDSQQIYHRWYINNELVCEVPMRVEGPRWRCWSEKTIAAGWQGDCHVEIVNEAGERIGETRFALTDEPAAAADWQNQPAVEQPADGS